MTAHKSKGLEFEVVFIIKGNEERWTGKTKREYFILPLQKDDSKESRNMDERRLFYVALTRAKEKLFITYSDKDYKGKILSRSSFIENIDSKLLQIEKGEKVSSSLILTKESSVLKRDDFKNYVSKILFDEGINVTALNNYLNCPWKYFFQNLIKIPHAQEKHQQFGTAIHYSLKMLAEDFNSGKKLTLNNALKYFNEELSKMDFSSKELNDWKQRGKEGLTSFFKGHVWTPDTKSEFKMSSIPFSSTNGVISLKGNIDQLINKSNGNFIVLDFKTGSTKTRNEIIGNTKNSNGDIFRQLLFYKLMLETYFKDKRVDEGIIEFVEPDDKGRFKKESFDLVSESLEGLKADINTMIKGLINLEFVEKKCDERGCEFCEMGEVLKEKI
jgi:DNA helicase-2/ATP-dependent DNA helicase PcrA